MRRSFLKTVVATAVVGAAMALSSVAAWAETHVYNVNTLSNNVSAGSNIFTDADNNVSIALTDSEKAFKVCSVSGITAISNLASCDSKAKSITDGSSITKYGYGSAAKIGINVAAPKDSIVGIYFFNADCGSKDPTTLASLKQNKLTVNNTAIAKASNSNNTITYYETTVDDSGNVAFNIENQYLCVAAITVNDDDVSSGGSGSGSGGGETPDPSEPAATYTTEYDIANALLDANNAVFQYNSSTEPNSGSIAATTADMAANAPALLVDTTTGGKVGYNNASWAQFTEGAKLTIPNVPTGAVITLSLYQGTTANINDEAYSGPITTTSDGDVVIESQTGGGYIKSITVVSTSFAAPAQSYFVPYKVTAKNGDAYIIGRISKEDVNKVTGNVGLAGSKTAVGIAAKTPTNDVSATVYMAIKAKSTGELLAGSLTEDDGYRYFAVRLTGKGDQSYYVKGFADGAASVIANPANLA